MSRADRDELHEALREAADAASPRTIDLDAVLRASRARRRARRTAVVGGTGVATAVLAVGGLVFGLQQGAGPTSGGAPAAVESAERGDAPTGQDGGGTPESATGYLMAPADVLRCGEPAASATDAATSPLVVALAPPTSVAVGRAASATVTVTNSGDARVEGELSATPAVAVVADGTTVSHSRPTDGAMPVSLAPGESVTLTGVIETARCSLGDAASPTGTPQPLPRGRYEVGVVVGFAPVGGEPVHLVSPLVPLTIR